jgi:hypothetical protein
MAATAVTAAAAAAVRIHRRRDRENGAATLGVLASASRRCTSSAAVGEGLGHLCPVGPDGDRRLGEVGRQNVLPRTAGKWRPTRQELIGQHPDGIDVSPMIDARIGRDLLGRHVRRRAEENPGRGNGVRRSRGGGGLRHANIRDQGGLRHPKIRDHRVAPGEEHVVRFDVSMDDPALVRVRQRVTHVAEHEHRVVHRKRTIARKPLAQRRPGFVRHDVVQAPVGRPGVVERHDMRMVELGGDLDFAKEPFGP